MKRKEEKSGSVPFEHNIEFLVDPFFRKTTQMFDEASAKGMLLNNLRIDHDHMLSLSSGKVIEEGPNPL
jgi:Condensin complex subunit 2